MTILVIYGAVPATALGAPQLRENLVTLRNAWRDVGRTSNLAELVSGGTPFSMGLTQEFTDWESWAAAQDEGMPQSVMEVSANLPASGAIGLNMTTMTELPGLEVDSNSLPRGIMMTSRIKIHQGQATAAYNMVAKSKEIFTRLGGNVRVVTAVHAAEMGIIGFSNYLSSAKEGVEFTNKLMADPEWLMHWNDPARIGTSEVLAQTMYRFVD